jgi:hypothetical protein
MLLLTICRLDTGVGVDGDTAKIDCIASDGHGLGYGYGHDTYYTTRITSTVAMYTLLFWTSMSQVLRQWLYQPTDYRS